MRKLYVDQLHPGMALGKTAFNERGDVLLARGVQLTPRYIDALRRHGFYAVYVLDGVADDVEPPDILSERVRSATYKHVRELFEVAESAAVARNGDGQRDSTSHFAAAATPHVAQLYRDVERIVDEITNAETISGVVSLKSHDNYTFEHSIEVTVAGLLLGKRLCMTLDELHQLALGCLYHDIGKMVVPTEVLVKPGRLTGEEFALVQQHPEAGYETVRQITGDSDIIARQVVRQHHERQDGTGYPRGLRGINRFGYPKQSGFGQGLILPAAEVAAVADVYSALASDRPYRPALAPPEIVSTLQQMAGSHLNSEIVARFLSILPTYPTGTEVVVIGGDLRGYRGVVTEVDSADVHRPTVRMLFDPSGIAVAPFDIDTSRDRTVTLAMWSYEELATLGSR